MFVFSYWIFRRLKMHFPQPDRTSVEKALKSPVVENLEIRELKRISERSKLIPHPRINFGIRENSFCTHSYLNILLRFSCIKNHMDVFMSFEFWFGNVLWETPNAIYYPPHSVKFSPQQHSLFTVMTVYIYHNTTICIIQLIAPQRALSGATKR